jgi:hypothetical protein
VFRNFFTKERLEKMKMPDYPGINHIELSFWMIIQGSVYYSSKVMATNRYIYNKNSTNWRSQALHRNLYKEIYDLFPRLERMAKSEFGRDVDLSRVKEKHFEQMVLLAIKTKSTEDCSVVKETMVQSGKKWRYLLIIFRTLILSFVLKFFYPPLKKLKNIIIRAR